MRAAIVKSSGYLDNVILRILSNNNIKGDIVEKVTRSTLMNYDTVIFTYQNNVPNMPKLLERIVLEKQTQVIFIGNTVGVGQFYNLLNDIRFTFIDERTLEMVLPSTVAITSKFHKEIRILKEEYNSVASELKLLKLTNKAKRILIEKGLSEKESHKFIVNKAMELRVPKIKLVNLIIENKIDI